MKLVVTQDFGEYKRGDEITDPDTVAFILASHNASHVNQVKV